MTKVDDGMDTVHAVRMHVAHNLSCGNVQMKATLPTHCADQKSMQGTARKQAGVCQMCECMPTGAPSGEAYTAHQRGQAKLEARAPHMSTFDPPFPVPVAQPT